jgi:hypothetical protein
MSRYTVDDYGVMTLPPLDMIDETSVHIIVDLTYLTDAGVDETSITSFIETYPEGLDISAARIFNKRVDVIYLCRDILSGRNSEIEELILQAADRGICIKYAKEVIRGRWEEIEPLVLHKSEFAMRYFVDVFTERWDELQTKLREEDSFYYMIYELICDKLGY